MEPPVIKNTLTEVLCKAGIHEYALSETQKYGHVTYFWNGNRSGKVDANLEVYDEIPSDVVPFEKAPAMKSVEITDHMIDAMASHKFEFLRCNYPNGDMVGHTGVIPAAVAAVEAVDSGVGKVVDAIRRKGGFAFITADHGNCDKMIADDGTPHTAHTTAKVPFIFVDGADTGRVLGDKEGALCDIAPTLLDAMGLSAPAEMTGHSLFS